jgi:hypothetical protein
MFLWSKWDVLWESHDLNESKRGERERERERERGGGGGAWHSICQQPTTKKVVGILNSKA